MGHKYTIFFALTHKEKLIFLLGGLLKRVAPFIFKGTQLKNHSRYLYYVGQHDDISRQFNTCLVVSIANDHEIGNYKVVLRKETSDASVFNQVLFEKEYKALADYVEQYTSKRSVGYIIDAGGNIGLTTLYFKRRFPNARIVTIEPDRNNLLMLKRNIRLNRMDEDVTTLRAGLWGNSQHLEIDRGFRDGKEWSITLVPSKDARNHAGVQGYTVREIMDKYGFPHVDILKIDIEGAEQFVFGDDDHVAGFLEKVKFIALEIHDEFSVRSKILLQLMSNHFEYFHSGELTIGVNRRFLTVKDKNESVA